MSIDISRKTVVVHAYNTSLDEAARADSKANITISIQSLVFSLGLGTALITDTVSKVSGMLNKYRILFLIFVGLYVATTLIGIIFSIVIYKDRIPSQKKNLFGKMKQDSNENRSRLYYRNIESYDSAESYIKDLKSLEEDDIFSDYAKQTYNISNAVVQKMKWVNRSIIMLIINLVLSAILFASIGLIILI
ncbi:MAG: hypothetical protein HZR80_18420 [Candidatus Heimdallarchaeota archaeon]